MTAKSSIKVAYDAAERIGPAPLQAITLADFLRRDFPPREMLLAPCVPAQGIVMVYAARGIGKTHLALSAGYAIGTGGRFLKWSAPAPRRVLLLDGEMPAAALQERLADLVAKTEGDLPADDYFRLLPSDMFEQGLPDLSTKDGQDALAPHIGNANLIIVDNLSILMRSGKENESESWGTVQAWALEQRRAGRSVLFIHHAGKGGDQRGTSKREDVMDTVIKLSLPDDYEPADGARFIVTFTKHRGFYGPDAEPFEAMLRDGAWSTKDIQDGLAEQAHQLAVDGMPQRKIAKELGLSLSKVNRLLAQHKESAACR